jgi:hypothetical protein
LTPPGFSLVKLRSDQDYSAEPFAAIVGARLVIEQAVGLKTWLKECDDNPAKTVVI